MSVLHEQPTLVPGASIADRGQLFMSIAQANALLKWSFRALNCKHGQHRTHKSKVKCFAMQIAMYSGTEVTVFAVVLHYLVN